MTSSDLSFDVEQHPLGLDWLYRPVDEGWCSAVALLDGTVSLHHIAEWNEVLEFKDENERRAAEKKD